MADVDSKKNPEFAKTESEALKYLEFIQVATVHTVKYLSDLYANVKDKSGPLRSGVEKIEGTVKTTAAPVYQKFHDVPLHLLQIVDHKVDESLSTLDNHIPKVVKEVSTQAYSTATKAPEMARAIASEVQRTGVKATATGMVKSGYDTCEHVVEHCALSTWRSLHRLPIFTRVADVVVPAAARLSEKYNDTVNLTAEKGYKVSLYLPLIPTVKIAEIFKYKEATE